jgi:hypothetical protein
MSASYASIIKVSLPGAHERLNIAVTLLEASWLLTNSMSNYLRIGQAETAKLQHPSCSCLMI